MRDSAIAWYLTGSGPKAIVRRLHDEYGTDGADTPGVNTVKQWLRRYRYMPTGEPWNFDEATPEERRLVAPILSSGHGWPRQEVADWFIRIRQLVPDWSYDYVFESAVRLADIDERIKAGTATDQDRADRQREIVTWLDACGVRQPDEDKKAEIAWERYVREHGEEPPTKPATALRVRKPRTS
jgi:hypothetical protein